MMSQLSATLTCTSCGKEVAHELRYAGRLLVSTTCSDCGYVLRHEERHLLVAYVHDLEQRLSSKPRRMLTRAARDPVAFTCSLPAAVVAKPLRMLQELKELLRS
jgi:predicted RNA-binding Zn-ribbon protein involved in translation (DUF1610 family)